MAARKIEAFVLSIGKLVHCKKYYNNIKWSESDVMMVDFVWMFLEWKEKSEKDRKERKIQAFI